MGPVDSHRTGSHFDSLSEDLRRRFYGITDVWPYTHVKGFVMRVLLPGSSALLLARGATESLAGRYFRHRCSRWSFSESRKAFGWDLDWKHPLGSADSNRVERDCQGAEPTATCRAFTSCMGGLLALQATAGPRFSMSVSRGVQTMITSR